MYVLASNIIIISLSRARFHPPPPRRFTFSPHARYTYFIGIDSSANCQPIRFFIATEEGNFYLVFFFFYYESSEPGPRRTCAPVYVG